MREAGIDVRLDSLRGDMHHKVILIDRAIVVTGSYNFSRSAEEQNDENLLILHAPKVAAEYLIEFDQIFRRAPR
jgi:phosphatidylserine/phosphatidylglycerophosphate/cardiolipin synthase-like enzyme